MLAPASLHDSPLLAPTLDKLAEISPLPEGITIHLDAGYDSQKTPNELAGQAPVQFFAQPRQQLAGPARTRPFLDCVFQPRHTERHGHRPSSSRSVRGTRR